MSAARRVFVAGVALLSMGGLIVACTHDFDAFEANGGEQDGATTTQPDGNPNPVLDSGTIGSIGDSATATDSSKPPDATVDAPPGCQQSAANCITQRTTCLTGCTNTYNQCVGPCPNGNPGKTCRDNCKDAQTLCANNCVAACQTCAGATCAAICN